MFAAEKNLSCRQTIQLETHPCKKNKPTRDTSLHSILTSFCKWIDITKLLALSLRQHLHLSVPKWRRIGHWKWYWKTLKVIERGCRPLAPKTLKLKKIIMNYQCPSKLYIIVGDYSWLLEIILKPKHTFFVEKFGIILIWLEKNIERGPDGWRQVCTRVLNSWNEIHLKDFFIWEVYQVSSIKLNST